MRVALVVGAGGPTGGPFMWSALAALQERTGWDPASANVIVGTSAGAFVASTFTAQAPSDAATVEALRSLALTGDQPDLTASITTRVATVGRKVAGRAVALAAPRSRPLADYRVAADPFHPGAIAVTVEHRTGQRVSHVLTEVADPQNIVRASASIPFMNGPVELDGRVHVDGAVHSANNADVVDLDDAEILVVISPMIPATGGSLAARFHRAQLSEELRPWVKAGRAVLAILPNEVAHADRTDRDTFPPQGGISVNAL